MYYESVLHHLKNNIQIFICNTFRETFCMVLSAQPILTDRTLKPLGNLPATLRSGATWWPPSTPQNTHALYNALYNKAKTNPYYHRFIKWLCTLQMKNKIKNTEIRVHSPRILDVNFSISHQHYFHGNWNNRSPPWRTVYGMSPRRIHLRARRSRVDEKWSTHTK